MCVCEGVSVCEPPLVLVAELATARSPQVLRLAQELLLVYNRCVALEKCYTSFFNKLDCHFK